MARRKLQDSELMRPAHAKLPPELYEQVRQLAEDREWTPSQTIRFLVSKGLEYLSNPNLNGEQNEQSQSIA